MPLSLESDEHAQDQREAEAPNCFDDSDMSGYHSVTLIENGGLRVLAAARQSWRRRYPRNLRLSAPLRDTCCYDAAPDACAAPRPLRARTGNFQLGRTKWHVYPLGTRSR